MARAFRRTCKTDCSSPSSARRRKGLAWGCRSRRGSSTNTAARWSSSRLRAKAPPLTSCCPCIATEDDGVARILIIDDDQSVPRALQAALTKVGHEVTIATDAEEGRMLAEEQECEVVVADLHWEVGATKQPKPQGLDIIARLRATKPQLPIILMTA